MSICFQFVCLTILSVNRFIQDFSKTTDPIVLKFYGVVGRTPVTDRVEFGGNPDLDPDKGIFEGILPLRYWLWQSSSSRGRKQSQHRQASVSQIEHVKCMPWRGLRSPSACILVLYIYIYIIWLQADDITLISS